MKTFIQRFGQKILGVLHGPDRLRFRGSRRFLASVTGMLRYLWRRKILLKDFKAFAGNITAQVREAAEEGAVRSGRPVLYLPNGQMDKEAWARQVAKRDGIHEGLIGVLKECRALLVVRGRRRPRGEKTRPAGWTKQVPALLPLLSGPRRRPGVCAFANVVSLHRAYRHEWSGMVGPANGWHRLGLSAA